MSVPFLTSKLSTPPQASPTIQRAHLLRQLDHVREYPLTLVSAPAGFGKSTLLGQWQSRPPYAGRTAWLWLEETENAPERLFGYLVAALQQVAPDLGRETAAMLHTPGAGRELQLDTALALLENDLGRLTEDLYLVLDDYHMIDDPIIHDAMVFLIEHLPTHVHFLVASRSDPPWPLARWRARGLLLELRMAHLAFTPGEAAALLNDLNGLGLAEPEVAVLASRTEGWAAGLHLAALAMRNLADRPAFVRAFSGSHQYLLDFLVEEVLDREPEHVRAFLLSTSILRRLNGSLCAAVGGRDDGGPLLRQLQHADLFLIPLDPAGTWYRYHYLFAELLQLRLREQWSPAQVADLHGRAAEWYERDGIHEEAMYHWRAAGNHERAAQLLAQIGRAELMKGETSRLREWLAGLPEAVRLARPTLPLLEAWTDVITGRLAAVEPLLAAAEATGPADPRVSGEVATLRAMALMVGDQDQRVAMLLAGKALEQLPAEDAFARCLASLVLGAGYRFDGQTENACRILEEGVRLSQAAGDRLSLAVMSYNLGSLYAAQGLLRRALEANQQALRLVVAPDGVTPLPAAGILHQGLAEVLYEWNELDRAAGHLQQAVELSRRWGYRDIMLGSMLQLARIMQAQGKPAAAGEWLARAQDLIQAGGLPSPTLAGAAAMHATIVLARGEVEDAARIILAQLPSDPDLVSHRNEADYLFLARVLRVRGEVDQARKMLQKLAQVSEAGARTGTLIAVLAGLAMVAHAVGDMGTALATIGRALVLAEPAGFVRTFLDEGRPMAELLTTLSRQATAASQPYIQRLRASFPEGETAPAAAGRQPLVDPLSERELAVLRLMAAGDTNAQIAADLVLAEGTVKKHTSNIFGKLGVNNRTQAILRARELGLV